MRLRRCREEQIVAIVREREDSDSTVAQVAKTRGVTETAQLGWRQMLGGLGPGRAAELLTKRNPTKVSAALCAVFPSPSLTGSGDAQSRPRNAASYAAFRQSGPGLTF